MTEHLPYYAAYPPACIHKLLGNNVIITGISSVAAIKWIKLLQTAVLISKYGSQGGEVHF